MNDPSDKQAPLKKKKKDRILKSRRARKIWVGFMIVFQIALVILFVLFLMHGKEWILGVDDDGTVTEEQPPWELRWREATELRVDVEKTLQAVEKQVERDEADPEALRERLTAARKSLEKAVDILHEAATFYGKSTDGETSERIEGSLEAAAEQMKRIQILLDTLGKSGKS